MPESDTRQRIGVFGGTFDPIHVGHLLLAELSREQLALDGVYFVPAAVSPLKVEQPPTSAKHRLEMVRLAIGGNSHFRVDERELQREGPSYTVDTLRAYQSEHADAALYFLMGADSLADLPYWREPQAICQLAQVMVLARGGHPPPKLDILQTYLPAEPRQSIDQHVLEMPQMEISSRDLRRRIADGRSTRYQLHPAVEAYIDANGLYQT